MEGGKQGNATRTFGQRRMKNLFSQTPKARLPTFFSPVHRLISLEEKMGKG